jgi:hypothetical protein
MATVNRKANDLEILWIPPVDDSDERVPTAEELAANSHLGQQNLAAAQRVERPAGLKARPTFSSAAGRGLVVPAGLSAHAPGHPALVPLPSNVTITLPALADTVSSVSRYDRIYLMVFGAIVTSAIDSDILMTFGWDNQSNVLQTLTQENTRRIRTVWALVCSQGVPSASSIYSALTTVGTEKALTVSKAAAGTTLSSTLQIYPQDPNLVDTKQYVVLQDTIELIDLCRVWRVQNFSQTGYVWGRTGESTTFDPEFHIQPTYRFVGDGWEEWQERARETFRRVILGLPLIESPGSDRYVTNLINGNVSTNLDAPGIATASPNGSTALTNTQRVSFTNERIVQQTFCTSVLTASSTGGAGGLAQATIPFQTNSPAGSFFSQVVTDHKVFTAAGRDVTLDGTMTGLGGTGSLIWTANSAAIAAVGDTVYVCPGIVYPSGSGFAVTGQIERVFLDGTQINAANVLEAGNDIATYTNPAAAENHIVVLGRERAALHYIYQKFTVSSNSSGVVAIPSGATGAIAFISGTSAPTTRQDKPVITGLANSSSYTLLCYKAPPATEKWQFQLKIARYAGTAEKTLLNGSTISTLPICVGHTQGGGNSTFLADGELQYEAIAFRLPANGIGGSIKHFACNYRMAFAGEGDIGATSYREIFMSPAAGLTLPREGLTITTVDSATAQGKSLAVKLTDASGRSLGILKLPIQCAQVYQLVVAFTVLKAGERRLVICTTNEGNTSLPSGCAFDSELAASYSAIDTFRIY